MTQKTIAREIMNARVRIYHLETQVWRNGWIYDVDLPKVFIASQENLMLKGGYLLSVQIEFGELHLCGRIVGIDTTEQHQRKAPLQLHNGTSVKQPHTTCVCVEIGEDFSRKTSKLRARKAVPLTSALLFRGKDTLSIAIHDVSKSGAGVISRAPLSKGEIVHLRHDAEGETLELEGEVRFCRRIPSEQQQFFVGIEFSGGDRVTVARWKHIFQKSFEVSARSPLGDSNDLQLLAVEEVAREEANLKPLPKELGDALVHRAMSTLQRLQRVSQVERRLLLRELRNKDKFGNEAIEDAMMDMDGRLLKLRSYESELEMGLYQLLDQIRRDEDLRLPKAA